MRAARRVGAVALDDPVDGHLRHPPPRGQLAAGDRDHARSRSRTARPCARCRPTCAGRRSRSAAARRRRRRRGRSGSSAVAEERVDRVEQVVDVLRRRAGRGPARPRSRCRWCRSASARATAARRSCARRRPGTIAPAAIGSVAAVDDQVRAAARADHRHLGLVVELRRAQPVGPHAGRVDDVRGPHLELGAALAVAHARADRAPGVLQQRRRPRAGSRRPRRSARPPPSTVSTSRASSVWQS